VPPEPADGEEVSDAEQAARGRAMGAMASVLEVRLREVLREDLSGTYGVRVDSQLSRIPHPEYSLSISFGSDPERAEELIGFVYAELEKLKESGPTAQEIANVKAQMRRSYETSSRENAYWLNRLVSIYQTEGDPTDLDNYLDTVEALTPEAVHEAAMTYIDFQNMVRVTLMPEDAAQRAR
jgi:zinc protease